MAEIEARVLVVDDDAAVGRVIVAQLGQAAIRRAARARRGRGAPLARA